MFVDICRLCASAALREIEAKFMTRDLFSELVGQGSARRNEGTARTTRNTYKSNGVPLDLIARDGCQERSCGDKRVEMRQENARDVSDSGLGLRWLAAAIGKVVDRLVGDCSALIGMRRLDRLYRVASDAAK